MKVPDDVQKAAEQFKQGDLLKDVAITRIVDLGRPLSDQAKVDAAAAQQAGDPLGMDVVMEPVPLAVVVSQTCDVHSPARDRIRIAPVFKMPDPSTITDKGERKQWEARAKEIEGGRQVHKVWIENYQGTAYADLEDICPMEKSLLLGKKPTAGFPTEEGYREFAFRCGHVHDRPAVPYPVDRYVTKSLRKFLSTLKKKDPGKFALLDNAIDEEALWLDDWDTPTQARVHFLATQPIPDAVKEVLDQWWQSVDRAAMGKTALHPNGYDTFAGMNAATYRQLRKISHWYLSEDDS